MLACNNINILHIDCSAGLGFGLFLFVFLEWVSRLYNLPINVVFLLATANVTYGIYATLLAFSQIRRVWAISVLAIGNVIWACICIFIALYYVLTASLIGVVFIILEAVFVCILAYYEFKFRFVLTNPQL